MAKKKLTRKTARKAGGNKGRATKRAVAKSKARSAKPTARKKARPAKRVKAAPKVTKKTAVKKTVVVKKNSAPKVKRLSKTPSAAAEARLRNLDREILKLINQRCALTTKMIAGLANPQERLFDPRADDELLDRLTEKSPGPLPTSAVRGVFREILSAAKRQIKLQRVAYLGPPYSYTHLACIERFGKSADLVPVNTIAAVFEEVNRGNVEYGVVPIENSTDGRVVDTLDMFTRLPLRICGEVQISIHHNLLARCPRGEITEIYSKPQALSQCRNWLSRNMPQARQIEVTSTSTAAQLARDKPHAAAVASLQASVEYDLQVAAAEIEDNANNVTRFAVIGDDVSPPSGSDRTAIVLHIPHKPGSLSDALTAFKKNKANLTWIESFPLRGPESGYQFFLDFEGHAKEPRIKRTLAELEKKAVRLVVLGSYPRSEPAP